MTEKCDQNHFVSNFSPEDDGCAPDFLVNSVLRLRQSSWFSTSALFQPPAANETMFYVDRNAADGDKSVVGESEDVGRNQVSVSDRLKRKFSVPALSRLVRSDVAITKVRHILMLLCHRTCYFGS